MRTAGSSRTGARSGDKHDGRHVATGQCRGAGGGTSRHASTLVERSSNPFRTPYFIVVLIAQADGIHTLVPFNRWIDKTLSTAQTARRRVQIPSSQASSEQIPLVGGRLRSPHHPGLPPRLLRAIPSCYCVYFSKRTLQACVRYTSVRKSRYPLLL